MSLCLCRYVASVNKALPYWTPCLEETLRELYFVCLKVDHQGQREEINEIEANLLPPRQVPQCNSSVFTETSIESLCQCKRK